MHSGWKFVAVAALGGGLLGLSGCAKLEARNDLNKGVQAFKSAQFEAAEADFKEAIRLDPTFINAKLYLATAYQSQFVPGADSPDNMRLGQQAVQVYQDVLRQDPKNVNAVAGLAHLYFNMKDMDQARTWNLKQIALEPQNPTPHYFIGVIDWTRTFKANEDLRKQLGILKASDPLIGAPPTRKNIEACRQLAQTSMPEIEDGISQLKQAMQLRKHYANAMTYVNLLYRQKADMECGDMAARKADLAKADEWVAKSLTARKLAAAEAAKAASGGIHESSN
jgi:hypothetical protein